MTETADLIQRMGFGTPRPAAQRVATLSDYIADLFVSNLTDAELTARRQAGEYRNIRPDYLKGYHAMARGKAT